jgi:hypothetical protein
MGENSPEEWVGPVLEIFSGNPRVLPQPPRNIIAPGEDVQVRDGAAIFETEDHPNNLEQTATRTAGIEARSQLGAKSLEIGLKGLAVKRHDRGNGCLLDSSVTIAQKVL